MTTLYILSGLPGTGKTTLARQLAKVTNAVYLRIDTIERALRELCDFQVEGEGYRLAYRIAADNLTLGRNVVADSCNPIQLTRTEWQQVAESAGAVYVNIEVICSDQQEHRRRVEARLTMFPDLKPPDWSAVENRDYDPWSENRIVVDTAGQAVQQSINGLLRELGLPALTIDAPAIPDDVV